MKDLKSVKARRSYDAEFKQEMIRMLISGRSAKEISEAFGIAENVLYRWKRIRATTRSGLEAASSRGERTAEVGPALL